MIGIATIVVKVEEEVPVVAVVEDVTTIDAVGTGIATMIEGEIAAVIAVEIVAEIAVETAVEIVADNFVVCLC